jgi:hypothetical protein
MASYLIHDSAGNIVTAYVITGAEAQAEAIAAANTPAGCSAVLVPDGHAAIADQRSWTVSAGKPAKRSQ